MPRRHRHDDDPTVAVDTSYFGAHEWNAHEGSQLIGYTDSELSLSISMLILILSISLHLQLSFKRNPSIDPVKPVVRSLAAHDHDLYPAYRIARRWKTKNPKASPNPPDHCPWHREYLEVESTAFQIYLVFDGANEENHPNRQPVMLVVPTRLVVLHRAEHQ